MVVCSLQSEARGLWRHRGVPGRGFGKSTRRVSYVNWIVSIYFFSTSFTFRLEEFKHFTKRWITLFFHRRDFWQSRAEYLQGAVLTGQRPEPTRSGLQVHEPGQSPCHVELPQGIKSTADPSIVKYRDLGRFSFYRVSTSACIIYN